MPQPTVTPGRKRPRAFVGARALALSRHAAAGLARALRHRVAPHVMRLGRAERGAAALEFAMVGSIFVVLLLNVVDFALVIWARMEVNYAAEAGAQAAFKTCASGTMPATANCANLSTAVATAAQSTSLGTAVTLASSSPSEA